MMLLPSLARCVGNMVADEHIFGLVRQECRGLYRRVEPESQNLGVGNPENG